MGGILLLGDGYLVTCTHRAANIFVDEAAIWALYVFFNLACIRFI
jgi:hypothetical protein